jgi:hypothetical protein
VSLRHYSDVSALRGCCASGSSRSLDSRRQVCISIVLEATARRVARTVVTVPAHRSVGEARSKPRRARHLPRWLLPTNRAPRHIYQPCIRNFGMSIRPTTLRGMRWPCEPLAEVRRSGGRPHRTSQCHAFASLFAQSTWPRSAQGRLLVKSKLIVPSIPRARTCFLPAGGRVLIGPHRRGCSGSSNRSLP